MMTFSLFRSYPVSAIPSQAQNAKLAGRLLAACMMREQGLSHDLGGWRIVVGPIVDHREMLAEDLGCQE